MRGDQNQAFHPTYKTIYKKNKKLHHPLGEAWWWEHHAMGQRSRSEVM